ncbi:MAG TPA: transglycosylase SLT domain-containing protein [Synergistaceae bacterium]|nr:transglycosylase SLT domain-containing protein [Synergistaceae bacterium]
MKTPPAGQKPPLLRGIFLAILFLSSLLLLPSSGESAFFDNNRHFLSMRCMGDHKCDSPADKAIARFFREKNPKLSRETAKKYSLLVVDAAREFGVDPFLVAGIIVKESTVKANASSRGCYGLMQIKWSVHQKSIPKAFPSIRSVEDLRKPENNIRVGTYMLANFLRKHQGRVDASLDSYKGNASSRYKSTILKYYHRMISLYQKEKAS